jgi:hypothetical protein
VPDGETSTRKDVKHVDALAQITNVPNGDPVGVLLAAALAAWDERQDPPALLPLIESVSEMLVHQS